MNAECCKYDGAHDHCQECNRLTYRHNTFCCVCAERMFPNILGHYSKATWAEMVRDEATANTNR